MTIVCCEERVNEVVRRKPGPVKGALTGYPRATLLFLYVSTPLSVQRICTYPRYITEHQLCIIFVSGDIQKYFVSTAFLGDIVIRSRYRERYLTRYRWIRIQKRRKCSVSLLYPYCIMHISLCITHATEGYRISRDTHHSECHTSDTVQIHTRYAARHRRQRYKQDTSRYGTHTEAHPIHTDTNPAQLCRYTAIHAAIHADTC